MKKQASQVPIPFIAGLPSGNITYLMYLLSFHNKDNKYSSLISFILKIKDKKSLLDVLQNMQITYDLEPKVLEAVKAVEGDLHSLQDKPSLDIRVQKLQTALKALVNPSLKIDGLMGPETQTALNSIKERYSLDTDSQAYNKVFSIFKEKFPNYNY